MLLVENVRCTTGAGREVRDVELVVPRGQRRGLIVADAALRRTIIDLLAGRLAPEEGRVRVDGMDPIADAELLAARLWAPQAPLIATSPVTSEDRDDLSDLGSVAHLAHLAVDARADVWLLDEPAAGLPPHRAAALLRVLVDLHAAHRPTVLISSAHRAVLEPAVERVSELQVREVAVPGAG